MRELNNVAVVSFELLARFHKHIIETKDGVEDNILFVCEMKDQRL